MRSGMDAKHIAISHFMKTTKDKSWLHTLQVNVQNHKNETDITPLDLCLVIDASASMKAHAVVDSHHSKSFQNQGYAILDIIKHAVDSVVDILDSHDRIALVLFSETSEVLMKLISVTSQVKRKTKGMVWHPDGNINLWEGIQTGLSLLSNPLEHPMDQTLDSHRHRHLLVLTSNEAEGKEEALMRQYLVDKIKKSKKPDHLSCSFLGLGTLNHQLLPQVATLMNGLYIWVPHVQNIVSSLATAVSLAKTTWLPNLCFRVYKDKQVWQTFALGPLRYGQARCIQIAFLGENLDYDYSLEDVFVKPVMNKGIPNVRRRELAYLCGWKLTKFFPSLMDFKVLTKRCNIMLNRWDKQDKKKHLTIQDHLLRKDLDGITYALKHFDTWGKDYLPALGCAHALESPTMIFESFQSYGTAEFRLSVAQAKITFQRNKPLFRTHRRFATRSWDSQSTNVYISPSYGMEMDRYSKPHPLCFLSNSSVEMANGDRLLVQDVKKGDKVFCPLQKQTSTIQCVIQTTCQVCALVQLENLWITPWHPVFTHDRWQFPMILAQEKKKSIVYKKATVYNFVLLNGHTLLINGFCCVTLGHGFTEPVVAHPYYGTQMVLKHLQSLPTYQNGKITFTC